MGQVMPADSVPDGGSRDAATPGDSCDVASALDEQLLEHAAICFRIHPQVVADHGFVASCGRVIARGPWLGEKATQMARLEPRRPAMADEDRLEGIQQLSDVSRPIVAGQSLDEARRGLWNLEAQLPAEPGQAEADQLGHVLHPLDQRRDRQVDDPQPVVEIGTEGPLLHLPVEVPTGGRDHPSLHRKRLRASHTLEAPILEHAQELRLEGAGQLADLVEKDRPVGGLLETPRAATRGGEEAK